jgi:hypothetical protein
MLAKILAALLMLGARGERADRLAREVETVARLNPIAELGPERTALLLVAAVDVESSWRESVETCSIKGQAGEIGLTQLLEGPSRAGYSAADICASSALQLALGLRRIKAATACGADPIVWLTTYQRGFCSWDPTSGAMRALLTWRRIGGA